MSGVDVLAEKQIDRRKAIRGIVPTAPRKRKKAITKSDVDAAVTAVLSDLDREFRRLSVQFPKYRAPYDIARSVVRDARSLSARTAPSIDFPEPTDEPAMDAKTAEFVRLLEEARVTGAQA